MAYAIKNSMFLIEIDMTDSSCNIRRMLDLAESNIELVEVCSGLHQVTRIDYILNKTSRLKNDEMV